MNVRFGQIRAMTDDEWIDSLRQLAAEQSKYKTTDFETVRAALASTYAHMSLAEANPSDIYCRIPEAELFAAGAVHSGRLELNDWAWSLDDADLDAAVYSLGARVRALDALLCDVARHHGPPVDADSEYLCAATDWYVVPRLTSRIARSGHGGRATFEQRGTLEHRLLPRKIGSYTTSLHWLGDIAETSPDDMLGAAMFENFDVSFDVGGDPKKFSATGISCGSARDTIRRSVGEAHRSRCVAVAWPELTMRPEIELAALREALEDFACSEDAGGPLAFTLAGSWHVEGELGRENIAPVLNACGRDIFSHAKSRAYADNDYGIEDIQCGYRIPILVTQEQLVAFGICKDFCDLRKGIPYPILNVDLVVVGSIGNEATMTSHRAAAGDASIYGCRAFVVQQDLTTGTAETGWVLPPGSAPNPDATASLRTGCWTIHRAHPESAGIKLIGRNNEAL